MNVAYQRRRSDTGPVLKRLRYALRRMIYEFGKEPQGRAHHIWRDLVPLVALVLATIAVIGNSKTADRALDNSRANLALIKSIADARDTAILDACRADIAQDDVLRALISASLTISKQRESRNEYQRGLQLSRELMEPLGGLKPLRQKEITDRCERRLHRGSP